METKLVCLKILFEIMMFVFNLYILYIVIKTVE